MSGIDLSKVPDGATTRELLGKLGIHNAMDPRINGVMAALKAECDAGRLVLVPGNPLRWYPGR